VQALAHVNHSHADFKTIILPAVRALTMSMMVTGTSRQQEYLDTYGSALQGIRTVLDGYSGPVGSTVAIAGMCLALSEV
jgi:type IV secretory pathway VirB2 component (pilin)